MVKWSKLTFFPRTIGTMSQRPNPPTFNDLDSLFSLVNHLRLHLDRELEDQDLTTTQVQALMFIARVSGGTQQHCSAANLEAHLGLAKATNQHLLKRLKERGLVAEAPDDWGDLRRKRLLLTAKGERALEGGLKTWKHATLRMSRAIETEALSEIRNAARTSRGSQRRLHLLFKLEDNADWKYSKRHVLVGND